MTDSYGIPSDNLLNRWSQRRFVARQHKRDKASQVRLGLDTFPTDWDALMRGPVVTDMPERRIWMLWMQGEDEAPPMVRYSVDSWRRFNPGWRVEFLDQEALADWIDVPHFPPHTHPRLMANIIRLRLLSKYGGVWTDATTICLRPLDDWIDRALVPGFFAFAKPQPIRSVANWFIASSPGSPLADTWRRWCEIYLRTGKPLQSYFWMHHTFDWLRRQSPSFDTTWRSVPQVSARGPHVYQRLLDGHVSEASESASGNMADTPLAKLSWKKGYNRIDIEKVLSVGRS